MYTIHRLESDVPGPITHELEGGDLGRYAGSRFWAVAALVVLVASMACGGNNSATPRVDRNEQVTVAFPATIDTLDPLVGGVLLPLYRSVFDQLTKINSDGTVGPRLATDWKSNSDATTWTFTLRQGVKYQDGTPLTMDDVIYCFTSVLANPASKQRAYITQVKKVTKLSETQVQMDLMNPVAYFPKSVATLSIIPAATYKQLGSDGFALRPMGSGPYKVVSVNRAANSVDLKANKDYWGGAPQVQNVTFAGIADETARLNGLQSGAIDAAQISSAQAPTAQGDSKLKLVSTSANGAVFIGFNESVSPMGNVAFRQAIDLAIDRSAITKNLLGSRAKPLGQLVTPASFGYDSSIKPTVQDLNKAKQLIAQSGYKGDKIPFQYSSNGWWPLPQQVAEAVQGQLQAIGVNLDMRPTDFNAFVTTWINHTTAGMWLFGIQPNSLDAGQVVHDLFGKGIRNNITDQDAWDLDVKQASQTDPKQRQAVITDIWKLNKERSYYPALFENTYYFASTKAKVTVTPRVDGYIILQELKFPS
jgi:peptide/nickel transport system substrate-binding protein